MALRLYLDHDTAHHVLIELLRKAGHDVTDAVGEDMRNESDPKQLIHAIRENRILVTKNYEDFKDLSELIAIADGHHPGIFLIRQDNDANRDLSLRGIVTAIRKIEQAEIRPADICTVLNHWR